MKTLLAIVIAIFLAAPAFAIVYERAILDTDQVCHGDLPPDHYWDCW